MQNVLTQNINNVGLPVMTPHDQHAPSNHTHQHRLNAYFEKEIPERIDLLAEVATMLTESESDMQKVMDVIQRQTALLGLDEQYLQTYMDWDTILLTYNDGKISYSRLLECNTHHPNLETQIRICALGHVSVREKYSFDQLRDELHKIKNTKRNYSDIQVALGAGVGCGGFSVLFGGDLLDFLITFMVAAVGYYMRVYITKKKFNSYSAVCASAFCAICLSWLISFKFVPTDFARVVLSFLQPDKICYSMMACTLFLVPGIPLLTFVKDLMDGFTAISIVRAVKVLATLMAMSFGITLAILLFGRNDFATNQDMTYFHPLWVYPLQGALGAIGFSIIFNIPKHLIPVVGVGGAITILCRNLIAYGPSQGQIGLDQGAFLGSLIASVIINIICLKARHWFHTTHLSLVIPCVIPMIPGVLMYRSLYALINLQGIPGEVSYFAYPAIQALLILLAIGVGISKPHTLIRRIIDRHGDMNH